MQVLVATRRTQGQRADDVARTLDGELVFLPLPSWNGAAGVEHAGDARRFVGLESRKVTTTAEVTCLTVTIGDVVEALHDALAHVGYADVVTRSATAHRYAVEMLVVAGHFPVGTIVERHGDAVLARNDGPEVSA